MYQSNLLLHNREVTREIRLVSLDFICVNSLFLNERGKPITSWSIQLINSGLKKPQTTTSIVQRCKQYNHSTFVGNFRCVSFGATGC